MVAKVYWEDDADLDLCASALVDYEKFRVRDGPFGTPLMIKLASVLKPHKWWDTHGKSMVLLRTCAVNILPVLTTATSSEHAWSAQGVVQSARRQALNVDTIRRLVKVYINLRLEKRLRTGEDNDLLV